MNTPNVEEIQMPSYAEMYQKLLELNSTNKNFISLDPPHEVVPLPVAQDISLSEHDKLVRDFYQIMAKATHSEAPLANS